MGSQLTPKLLHLLYWAQQLLHLLHWRQQLLYFLYRPQQLLHLLYWPQQLLHLLYWKEKQITAQESPMASTSDTVKPSFFPPLVKVKDEPMDEEYERDLTSSNPTANIKDEPDTEEADLKISSVFSVGKESSTSSSASSAAPTKTEKETEEDSSAQTQTSSPLISPALPVVCSHCKKNLMIGQTAYRRKGSPDLFCSTSCLSAKPSGSNPVAKNCHFCLKLITRPQDIILAPVDAMGTMKAFCSQACLSPFNYKRNSTKKPIEPQSLCSMCNTACFSKHDVVLRGSVHKICSDTCFVRFRTVNNLTVANCENCGTYCLSKPITLKTKDGNKILCKAECLEEEKFKKNQVNVATTTPVAPTQVQTASSTTTQPDVLIRQVELPCFQCHRLITTKPEVIHVKVINSVQKINQKNCSFCSDGCELLYKCDLAQKWGKHCHCCAYCASISKVLVTGHFGGKSEDFCSVDCMTKYTVVLCQLAKCDTCNRQKKLLQTLLMLGKVKHFCDLQCLLQFCQNKAFIQGQIVPKGAVPNAQTKTLGHASTQTDTVQTTTTPRILKNKALLCRPMVQNKGVTCKTQTVDTGSQTDDNFPKVIVLPVPVPVFVPVPMNMYSQYTPKPMSLPIPLPVPMFLPVTLDSAEAIVEAIQEVKKIPSNPLEADLILMAEMVAEQDGKNEEEQKEKQNILGNVLCSLSSPPQGYKSRRLAEAEVSTAAVSLKGSSNKSVFREPPKLESKYGIDAWKRWIQWREKQPNLEKPRFGSRPMELKEDVLRCTTAELSYGLCRFIAEVKRPTGESYSPDSLFYLCLGIQQHLFENGHLENIFTEVFYSKFSMEITKILKDFKPSITASGYVHSRVEEDYLWDCKQLGASSPFVLLNTLLFLCSKNFGFTTVQQHRQLSFSNIIHCTKTNLDNTKTNFLRFYIPLSSRNPETDADGVPAKKQRKEESKEVILEMMENIENPLRCPVRLYEFYLSKCSESVKQRTNMFYLHPERSCIPNSPMWFSSSPLDNTTMGAMLTRILPVRALHLQPGKGGGRGQRAPDDPPFLPDDEEEEEDSG
ncbi:zinc finger MYM-type protein 4-like [Polymixia lowei]